MFEKISQRNRYLILGIGFVLILVYFLPIWHIGLTAPQYRDGLSMSIWLTKITGGGEFDLKNINLLNHYVGMREIYADDFKEFEYMPYILGFMIAGAFISYFYPRRIMVYLGLTNFLVVAIAGLYDFHKWEYDYGHNLSSDAPISIPGINFEPPLIACKAMMNFNACSWPHIGSILLMASGAVLTYIIWDEHKRNQSAT